MNTRRVDDYLKRLKRLEKFLESRLELKEKGKDGFFRSELLALKWLIRYAEDTPIEAADHQSKWFEENKENEYSQLPQ